MHTFSLQTIAGITRGKIIGEESLIISKISTDSRKATDISETLFVAIDGERHDGHKYLPEMYSKGVRCFLVSKLPAKTDDYIACGFVLVNNTIQALQEIAAQHRAGFNIPVVGITGSNGKTIVKEWLSYALGHDHKVTRSPKSYNSQIGVPLSVWLLDKSSQYGIFEAGISKPGEMRQLEKIIKPTHGIITNIGEAHQENFTSLEQKATEKLKLFENAEYIYYCSDYKLIHDIISKSVKFKSKKIHAWSHEPNNECMSAIINGQSKTSTSFTIRWKGTQQNLEIAFTDKASIENTMHVVNFLLSNNYSFETISKILHGLQPVAMRLEQVKGLNNCAIINDSYNSDLNSLGIALDYLNQQPYINKNLILSDIYQSGISESELYTEVSGLLNRYKIKRFIGIGQSIQKFQHLFSNTETEFYESTRQFLESDSVNNFSNEAILVKGARVFQFEQIVTMLSEKNHTTVLEINLNNLIYNLNYFRSLLKPHTGIMVMVKALAYGSGSNEIASLLQHEKVDYLGVAFTDEGVMLRQSGISLPIMVMSPGKEDFRRIVEYELEPEIYSFNILRSFIDAVSSMQIESYPVHIKIDTGMHRLGFMESDIDNVLNILTSSGAVSAKAVFSHLAASDDPKQDDFTRQQLACFNRVYAKISTAIGYSPRRHVLNSAGIERFPEAHFELVRLGIGLHGISSAGKDLLPVSKLITHISQIKIIPPGDTIGYNRRGKAINNLTLAIIPIGYADGLNRKFGNGNGHVIIHGREAPFIGDICMDMCMVDVTNIPCTEGDEVLIFGEQNPITRLAEQIGTIPYEILTNVSSRVKRIYYKD